MRTFDDLEIEIKCPVCKKSITISSSDVGSTIKCKFCESDIFLKDSGFTNGVDEANKLMGKLDNSLKNLCK